MRSRRTVRRDVYKGHCDYVATGYAPLAKSLAFVDEALAKSAAR